LCWFDSNAVKYVRRYKNISHHTYLLQCNNGEWEIKTKASGADVLAIRDEV
jgi:hypothetical protein